jgi:hypothetical protein
MSILIDKNTRVLTQGMADTTDTVQPSSAR